MSKARKSEVQLPGLKSKLKLKPKPKVVPPRGALSQEFVDSGDSSDEEPTPTRQNAPLQIGVHPPKANGVAKSTPKPAKTQKEISKAAVKAKAPAKKAAPKQVVTEEQGAESLGSSEESEDEGTDIKSAQQRQAASTPGGASESAGSSDSSSDDSEEEAAPKTTPKSATRPARPTQSKSHTVEFQAARPYVPPKDFVPVSTNRASTFPSTAVFHDLEGKQVWHITAPADLSLKGLKQLAMEQVMQGEAVISQKGIDYGFLTTEKDEGGEREVVIPRQNGYKAVSARISQTFNVRQVINLPKLSSSQADPNTGSEAAASITRSTIRAPRPQVKGLKMRYFPSGVGNHTPITLGFSDSEDEGPAVQPAGLGVPNGLHLASKPEKRKHVEMNGNEAMENPSKKHKKHKTQEEKKAKKERKRQKELAKTKS